MPLGSAELETYRRDVEEARGKLERLQEKLEEVQIQKTDVSSAIERTERLIHVQKNSTRAEVFRLRGKPFYNPSVVVRADWIICQMS